MITQVTFTVQLDTDAVQNHLSLGGWVKVLNIDVVEPTWDHVYRELATVLVGSPHYRRFCNTAQWDSKHWTAFKLYDRVETNTPATPGFEQTSEDAKPTEKPKVVTPPTPRKAGAKA